MTLAIYLSVSIIHVILGPLVFNIRLMGSYACVLWENMAYFANKVSHN